MSDPGNSSPDARTSIAHVTLLDHQFINCKSLAAHVCQPCDSAWQYIAFAIEEQGRDLFLLFVLSIFIRFEISTSQQLRSSSHRQHAEIEESIVDIFFFRYFFSDLSDDYSVDGCMRCFAASCKHSCRAATSVHLLLQAA